MAGYYNETPDQCLRRLEEMIKNSKWVVGPIEEKELQKSDDKYYAQFHSGTSDQAEYILWCPYG